MLPSILLIEENLAVRQVVMDLLTRSGSNVTHASNSSEGLELFKKQKFDLVITGSQMPVMDGTTLISELVKFTELPAILALSPKSFDVVSDPAKTSLEIEPLQRKNLLRLVSVALLTKSLISATSSAI